jgi:hypothetical protein
MTAMYQIASGKSPPIGNHITVSDNVTSFISACCAVDPIQRHSVELLLTHPFVNQPYSDDNTQIIISDSEDCTDSDLPSITEEIREIPSPAQSTPSPNIEPNKKTLNPEKGELTFKSRIPILQNRAMKLNVDSPDYPLKKSIEDQVTPSIYRLRKTREHVLMPTNPSPNIVQAPLLTPTPPPGERTNASTKFRKQTSRGQATGSESDSNKSTTPKSLLESPIHHFSDQELSPVNHTHFSPSQSLLRDTSVPQLQSIESLKNDLSPTRSPTKQRMMERSDPQSSGGIQEEGTKPQDIEESLNYTYSEDFECPPSLSDGETVNVKTPDKPTQVQPAGGSQGKGELSPVLSSPHNSAYSPVSKAQQLNHESPDNKKMKKHPRLDSKSAPNREKSDFFDDSDDNVPAILFNGSLMNSKGSLIEVPPLTTPPLSLHFFPQDSTNAMEMMRPAAPLSGEKLNLYSEPAPLSIKKNSSKQSLNRPTNSIQCHQQLKPLRKVTRKFRSRSANPPAICGPSKTILPPMAIQSTNDGRPVSLMRGNVLLSPHLDEQGNPISATPPPSIPLLQLRMIQSAPTVTRSVNLPPILGSQTPSKKLQTENSQQIRKVTKKVPLISLQKKASFEEHEETGGILAPRR